METETQHLDRRALLNATGGDIGMCRELLKVFRAYVPSLMSDLELASERNDPTAVRFGAHNLKNSLALVGALGPAATLERLEMTCRDTSQAQWRTVIEDVGLCTERVMEEIDLLLKCDADSFLHSA